MHERLAHGRERGLYVEEDEDGEDSDDWEDVDEDSDGSDSPYYAYGGQESVRMGRVALYIAATGERYRMR